ncbi:MAG TPA: 4-(cytidine 5'-diphospho)-2-C-methyl-D-erythritol kinase [Actinomycetota bacterium]|nr:4-(cytidine 5'-diphospho)-2-C-methyl-D-erythritol kinase [Actinomycetota bacterium]
MSVTRRAHAKLNVFLRVLGARDDGYHDVETVILPLELHDVVTAEPADGFVVTVQGARARELTRAGGEALVDRAARAWAHETGRETPGATISVEKRIPVAAGLGGGSADAAATILALDDLHGTDLSTETLLGIAAAVGSDVPALVLGGAVYADGRGDRVTPVHAQTTHWVVVPASFAVRTPDAYAWWDDGGTTGPDPGALIAAVEAGNDEILGPALFDDLQSVVAERHPEVADTIAALLDAGALGAAMSGSGPTVVALARHMVHADQIAAEVPGAFVTSGPPRTMGPLSGVV